MHALVDIRSLEKHRVNPVGSAGSSNARVQDAQAMPLA